MPLLFLTLMTTGKISVRSRFLVSNTQRQPDSNEEIISKKLEQSQPDVTIVDGFGPLGPLEETTVQAFASQRFGASVAPPPLEVHLSLHGTGVFPKLPSNYNPYTGAGNFPYGYPSYTAQRVN